jgi:sensor c-di-GMP phosphodiesterase-like protein
MIETEAQASVAAKLGIGYGQGWLYGRAMPELPALVVAQIAAGRRKGSRESWG